MHRLGGLAALIVAVSVPLSSAPRGRASSAEADLELAPGGMMFVPAGTPHGIKNVGDGPGRELVVSSPGLVFDAFIAEAAATMDPGRAAKLGPGTDFRAIASKYGIEFLT